MNKAEENPRNWIDLAKALGTTRKSLLGWRKKFADAPQRRDLKAWRDFIFERNLRPAHGWETEAGPRKAPALAPTASPDARKPWNGMHSLFPVMQAMQLGYEAGELPAERYLWLGNITLQMLKAISELWGSDIAPDGWDAVWEHIKGEVEKRIPDARD